MLIRHTFPVDGDYLIKPKLWRTSLGEQVRGLQYPHDVEVAIDGEQIHLATIGGPADFEAGVNMGDRPSKNAGLRPCFSANEPLSTSQVEAVPSTHCRSSPVPRIQAHSPWPMAHGLPSLSRSQRRVGTPPRIR